jgi:hypothetical protein
MGASRLPRALGVANALNPAVPVDPCGRPIIMSRYSCSVMPVMLPAICWKLLPSSPDLPEK